MALNNGYAEKQKESIVHTGLEGSTIHHLYIVFE
jgi:hypothetical protein